MTRSDYHMTPEAFRQHGHAVIDWIADYMTRVEKLPVLSQVAPGETRSKLPAQAPQQGERFEDILADMDKIVMPGVTHWQSPNFFAYFPANVSGPSILGELLSAGLGVQGMLWATSPACTEIETHVLDWLVDEMGLPEAFKSSSAGGGVIQDTASSSTLCAMLAARERATGFAAGTQGITQEMGLVMYATAHAHSSIAKGARISGVGYENLRTVPVDAHHAMDASALEEMILADIASGLKPCFVNATIGTTSSNAMDPIRALGEVCRRHGVWLHVDAAMSGTATICPEFRGGLDGLELSDSYCFNPHKWMFVNFDCNCFWVADRDILTRTLGIMPEYLRNQATESGQVWDYRDWHIPLGRRFRALKLWFVIRHYGVEGLRHHIREHVALAQRFADWVRQDEDFEIAAPHPLNLVCFRHKGGDEINQRIMDHLNHSGMLYLSHTRLDDRFTLRMSIGGTRTQAEHVERAWKLLRETGAAVTTPSTPG